MAAAPRGAWLAGALVLFALLSSSCTLTAEQLRQAALQESQRREVAALAEDIEARFGVEIVREGQQWQPVGLKAVRSALELLPYHVVRSLGNPAYGPLRILSNAQSASLSGARPYTHGANYYTNGDGRNEVVLVPNQGTTTILHELGHAYQMRWTAANRYVWVYLQPEMRSFMAAARWRLLSSNQQVRDSWDGRDLRFSYSGPKVWQFLSQQNPAEDYANSFAFFYYDAEKLQTLSPERYDWFLKHLGPR